MKSILAVAHDPGGAAALRPVLAALYARRDRCLVILAQSHAVFTFADAGLTVTDCGRESLTFDDLCEWAVSQLLHHAPDLLITGTSGKASFERAFIRASRSTGTQCLTVLDSWTNYTRRFLEPGESKLLAAMLPDIIAVVDDFAVAEMQSEGFPAEIIRITGQPALDELLRWSCLPEARKSRQVVRQRYQLAPETPLVVFVSQPIDEMYPPGSTTYRGYTEFDVLADILHVLSLLSPQPLFLVKTHPRAEPAKFTHLLAQSAFPATLAEGIATEALVQAANLVIGMTSIVLMQSVLLGKNVLSYQPNLIGQDALVISRMGLIETVKDRAGLATAVRAILISDVGATRAQSALPEIWQDGCAVGRICNLVDSIFEK